MCDHMGMAMTKKQKTQPAAKQPAKRVPRKASARPDLEQALHELIKHRAPALRELAKH